MGYLVHLLNESGKGSYLSVKDKIEWKTKKTAVKHAKDIMAIKNKTHRFVGLVEASVEDECGNVVESFRSE